MFFNYSFPLSKQKICQPFRLTYSINIGTMYNLLQHPLHADMWRTIKNIGKLFGGTGVDMHDLLKLTHNYKNENYQGTRCVSSSQDSQ